MYQRPKMSWVVTYQLLNQTCSKNHEISTPFESKLLFNASNPKELLKYTPEDHPDYNLLIDAKSKIEDVVLYINEGRRAFEEQQKIMEIQNKIDGLTVRTT